MTVEISSTLLHRLLNEAEKSPDREVCGLLFGTAARIIDAQACANIAPDPRRFFEIDPAALFTAHRAARRGGPAVIGHYHSHPTGLPIPSPRDADAASGDGALWLIVTADAARAWRAVRVGMFEEVVLVGVL